MPDKFFTEAERQSLERLIFWVSVIRSCAMAVMIVAAIGGVVALGPLLLQVAR